MQVFFLHIDIYMFLKPADMENGIKKKQKCPLKKNSYTMKTGNWKKHFLIGTRILRPQGWITSLKKQFLLQFFISKRPASFKNSFFFNLHFSDPPPLSGMSSYECKVFYVLPYLVALVINIQLPVMAKFTLITYFGFSIF